MSFFFVTIDINSLSSPPHDILEHVSAANFQLRNFQNVFDLLLELASRCCPNLRILKEKIP